MMSLGWRRTALDKEAATRSFLGLPDDILILIVSRCCIDELLALNIVHPRLHSIIADYSLTIAPAVARATFPQSERLLRLPEDGSPRNLAWLQDLIPQQLAAILVDKHRVADKWAHPRYGIPAEDPFGDGLRARVANGWRVLWRLWRVSQEVNSTYMKISLKDKLLRPSRSKVESLLSKENTTLEQRIECVKSLPEQHVKDYKLLFTLLSAGFSTSIANVGDTFEPWIFDSGDGIDAQRTVRRGHSWMTWFILSEGPRLFWKQWWVLPPGSSENYIRDLALATFRRLPTDLSDHQRSLMETLQRTVNAKADARKQPEPWSPYPYFTAYRVHRIQQQEATGEIHQVKEIMAHVPFRVEFRCPAELLERSAFLLESASRAARYGNHRPPSSSEYLYHDL